METNKRLFIIIIIIMDIAVCYRSYSSAGRAPLFLVRATVPSVTFFILAPLHNSFQLTCLLYRIRAIVVPRHIILASPCHILWGK